MPRKKIQSEPEKPPRRKPGTGRVRSRADGRYELTWEMRDTLGRTIEQRVYLPKAEYTLEQVHAWLDERIKERDTGAVLRDRLTLAAYLAHWMETFPKRAGTNRGRLSICQKWLIPALGELDLTEVTKKHCRALWQDMHNRGATPGVIKNVRATLIAAYRDAARDPLTEDLINGNPAKESLLPIFPPQVDDEDEERRISTDLVRALIESEPDPTQQLILTLCAYLGMRIGEVLALPWTALDMPGYTGLKVRQTLVFGLDGWLLNGPKTTKGKRWLPVFGDLIPLLEQRKAQQDHEQRAYGFLWIKNRDAIHCDGNVKTDLIFTRPDGRPMYDATVRKRLRARCKVLGVEAVTPHQFRHTTNPLLLELGIPERIVELIMGHNDARINRHYTHTEKEYLRERMAPIEQRYRQG